MTLYSSWNIMKWLDRDLPDIPTKIFSSGKKSVTALFETHSKQVFIEYALKNESFL